MPDVTDAMAGIVRQVDGDSTLTPTDLGRRLAGVLPPFFANEHGERLVAFVERTNADKRLDSVRLAEMIVAEFDLDEVAR